MFWNCLWSPGISPGIDINKVEILLYLAVPELHLESIKQLWHRYYQGKNITLPGCSGAASGVQEPALTYPLFSKVTA